ncbi:MAG: hypothetical protein M0R38_10820 [Bacteroidia bacterium]|nr:hypothetical protein [Bacteroidia bacterium]
MRNKGKIIAILLISIMVTVMIISCEDPMAKYSNDDLVIIVEIGMELSYGAFSLKHELVEEEFPNPGTYQLEELDISEIANDGDDDDDDWVEIPEGQLILLEGEMIFTENTGTISAKIKINNFKDAPSGTFNVIIDFLYNESGTTYTKMTVNGRNVNFNN